MFESLSCPNCGAAIIPTGRYPGSVTTCEFCRTSFRIHTTLTPEPDMGNLLLGADFLDSEVPGWVVVDLDNLEFKSDPTPELWARYPKSDRIHPVLRTPAPLDDFDASVTIRFIEGSYEHVSAGLELRSSSEGDYVIRISAQGTFSVGWHDKLEWGGNLVKWTTHPALNTEMGDANRLRVVMKGSRIRVYINGMLATSLRDGKFEL